MKTYSFQTTTTMKDYNCKKYWIDSGIVRPVDILADTLREALEKFRDYVMNECYISISKNALKCKSPMYVGDGKQIGYVITGKTEIDCDYRYTEQYIDLWCTISEKVSCFD